MKPILVHGYMVYKCEKCGKEFRMWCEKGIEDGGKPSPFVIIHTCGGFAKDISGLISLNRPLRNLIVLDEMSRHDGDYDAGYMTLPEGESYFANCENLDCGKSVLRE